MLAIGLRLLAVICLAIMFAAVKVAGQRGVHVVETLFYRQFLALPLILGWLWMGPGFTSVKTARISAHASRTLVGMIGMVLNFLSVMLLPLAEATTIGFTVPILATILSSLMMREATGIHRWTAVIIGFCGVLVMAQPTPGQLPATGVAVAVAAAISVATVSILLRQIGRTEATTTTVFWFTILALPPLAIGMFFCGQAHDALTWGLLAIIGLAGGMGQLRSEEHTSELQSLMRISYAVFCLKKKKRTKVNNMQHKISIHSDSTLNNNA